jgi:PhnB protein
MPMLDSYLFFNGNCAEAMRFYAEALGAPITGMIKYSESPEPDQCPPNSGDRIMHASILVDGRNLMASDVPAGDEKPVAGFALSLFYDTPAEAQKIFDVLSKGGSITMPLAETFWARTFGMFTDKFGIPWMVSGGSKMPAPQK